MDYLYFWTILIYQRKGNILLAQEINFMSVVEIS